MMNTFTNVFYSYLLGSFYRLFYNLYFAFQTIRTQYIIYSYSSIGIRKLKVLFKILVVFPIVAVFSIILDFLFVPLFAVFMETWMIYTMDKRALEKEKFFYLEITQEAGVDPRSMSHKIIPDKDRDRGCKTSDDLELTDEDIARISRTLEPYIKTLNSEELFRLESNVSQETKRLVNKLKKDFSSQLSDEVKQVINHVSYDNTKVDKKMGQLERKINTLQTEMTEIKTLLKDLNKKLSMSNSNSERKQIVSTKVVD